MILFCGIENEYSGYYYQVTGNFVPGPARENRENFIFRPRRTRRLGAGAKKHVLVTDWDPRNPDIAAILRKHKNTLYCDPVKRRVYPEGSVIAGFRRVTGDVARVHLRVSE